MFFFHTRFTERKDIHQKRLLFEYLWSTWFKKKLIENRINSKTSYELISNVDVGPHVGLAVVEQIANKITEDFGEIYNENTDDI